MTRALCVWCALWVGACTTERMIGSTCEDGMCVTGSTVTRIPCLVATGNVTIRGSSTSFDDMCVTDLVHKDDDDMAPCRMLYSLGDASRTCDSLGLERALDITDSDTPVCEIPQLDLQSRGTLERTATGWYIDGPGLPPADSCASSASQHAHLNGPLPVSGATRLVCVEAFAEAASISPALRDGDDVQRIDPASCAALPPLLDRKPEGVGSVCRTRFEPPEGFYTNRTYVDVRSEQCETGVCLVDARRSMETWPCPEGDEQCRDAGAPDLGNLSYCSCRCDAKGDQSRVACECPSGFTCRDVLSGEAPGVLAGGYCTRESAF